MVDEREMSEEEYRVINNMAKDTYHFSIEKQREYLTRLKGYRDTIETLRKTEAQLEGKEYIPDKIQYAKDMVKFHKWFMNQENG